MTQIVKRVWICAPPEAVWEVIADFGHVDLWAPTVTKCVCPGGKKRGVGAKRTLTTTRKTSAEETVIEWNEKKNLTFEITKGLPSIALLQEAWYIQRWPQGTEVIVAMGYETKPGIFHRIVERVMMRGMLTDMLVKNLAGLKHHVETGQVVTPQTPHLPISAVS
jgi:hypothetical protein